MNKSESIKAIGKALTYDDQICQLASDIQQTNPELSYKECKDIAADRLLDIAEQFENDTE